MDRTTRRALPSIILRILQREIRETREAFETEIIVERRLHGMYRGPYKVLASEVYLFVIFFFFSTQSMVEETTKNSTTSQNGYTKPVSNGTAGYTKTATESAYSNVYYSNGINNGFMSTKPVDGETSSSGETRKTK